MPGKAFAAHENAPREFLGNGVERKSRTREQIAAAARTGFDYPVSQVGTVGNCTVYYDPSLGPQGQQLADQMLTCLVDPYVAMEAYFGVSGAAHNLIIAPLSGLNDGTGGAYHWGCDFRSGGDIYVDATFADTAIDPVNQALCLYVAELSETFMGTQNRGWGCGSSNGEALSRFCAEREPPPGSVPDWAITAPAWDQAGRPDWINNTEPWDRNYISIGCGIVYIYWLRSLGFTVPQIVHAAGATLAANYQTLTGKTTAYQDLLAALSGVTITSDNPFAARPGRWNFDDLAQQTGAPPAAGNPRGYVFVAQGTQHVVYRNANGHVQELWSGGGWKTDDLTGNTGAPPAAGNPRGYVFDAQGTQHVVHRDANGRIQELWWDGGWHVADLTQQTDAGMAAGNPSGYVFDQQGTQHVMYRDTNRHIQELWWDGAWHANDLTTHTRAPLAAGDPSTYMFDRKGTQNVVYRDTNGHIQRL
ncbi:MAG TPA: hypothetical protein VMK12_01550, partial [Anaeromyxobacteraceae bacterium]|nr:hypothetical protein [Anaeromyxobacteraceae bacterium]